MNNYSRKVLATLLSISLIFTQGVDNSVRALPPEKLQLEEENESELDKKLKKKILKDS